MKDGGKISVLQDDIATARFYIYLSLALTLGSAGSATDTSVGVSLAATTPTTAF